MTHYNQHHHGQPHHGQPHHGQQHGQQHHGQQHHGQQHQAWSHNNAHGRAFQHNGAVNGNVHHEHGDRNEHNGNINNDYGQGNGNGPYFNNVSPTARNQELVRAVANGDAQEVKILCDCGANPNLSLPGRPPLLLLAVERGHSSTAMELMDWGARSHLSDNGLGQTILHLAVERCNEKVVRHLLEHNDHKPNIVNAKGQTPLHIAAAGNRTASAKALLENNANVNPSKFPVSPLCIAIEKGNFDTISLLLKKGANVHAQYPDGTSPIFKAAINRPRAIELLIQHGANVNALTRSGFTPLAWAIQHGEGRNAESVQLLLEKGAAMPQGRQTALDLARRHGFQRIESVVQS
ncbi:hypothetical protein V2G26_012632 [Clonostachys chloroleuca]